MKCTSWPRPLVRLRVFSGEQWVYLSLLGASIFISSVSFLPVIASFRGTVPYALSLEIGDTVQILEKCDGEWAGRD